MANKIIKGLTIQIGADTVGLDSALKGMETATKRAQSELKEVDKTIRASGDSAVLWEQKQKLINTALDESQKKLKLLEEAQEQVNRQMQNGQIAEEQYRAFQRETEYARAEVKKYENQLSDANDKLRELGRASDSAADDVDELGREIEEAGVQAERASNGGFTVMKGVLANLVTDGIRFAARELKELTTDMIETGAAFDAAIGQVAAISQASAEEVDQLREKAIEMGSATKFTAEQSAEAFNYMAMAGWKTEDMLSGIDGILGLAAASGEDLGITSDIVTDALTAFGLKAEDAGHFADVLAAASSNANTNVSMMGETFKYAAPIAGAFGFSIEDTAQAIGLMANAGIKSTMAGTALRTILTSLSSEIKVCGKEIGEYTVETVNADGTMRDLSDILADLRIAFSQLSESERSSQAEAIAGKNAMSGFLALVGAAPADVEKLSGAIKNCDGAAQNMAETMQDNLAGDIIKFQSAVDGAKIQLSKGLQPVLRDVVQYATEQVPKVGRALEPVLKKGAEAVKFVLKNLPDVIEKGKDLSIVVSELIKYALYGPFGIAAAFVTASKRIEEAHLEKVFEEAAAETNRLTDELNNNISVMADMKDKADKQILSDKQLIDQTKILYDELRTLVDTNGKVKSGYEDRVEYIVGELSEATGIEIEYIDGQIQKYGELKQSIDDVIQKKRAESMLNAYNDVYDQALLRTGQANAELEQLKHNAAKNRSDIELLRQKAVQNAYAEHKSTAALGEFTSANYDAWARFMTQEDLQRLIAAEQNIAETEKAIETLKEEFRDNQSIVENYESAVEQMCNNNYYNVQMMLSHIGDLEYAALLNAKGNTEDLKKSFIDAVRSAEKEYENNIELGDRNAKKTFKSTVDDITRQAKEGGISAGELLSTGIVNELSQIDGFDTQALMDFCEATGISMGEVLGSMTRDTAERYIAEIHDSIDMISNSGGFAGRYIGGQLEDVFRHIGLYAEGGTLREGQGIVAEAGPELISINNGTARITPLTGRAKNTPVELNGGHTVINKYYNIKANVSNRYDVYRLAEELANAEKVYEAGMGLV